MGKRDIRELTIDTTGDRPLKHRGPRDVDRENRLPFQYDAQLANEIESRWQSRWQADGTFNAPNPSGPLSEGFDRVKDLRRFYVMDMFPYPSGAGLHVGHPLGYIGTDVFARFLRMTGHNVLHPIGYDAFGLPAEQYALETGQHPAVTTAQNIANMSRQLARLGLGFDQRRRVVTSDASYYRWTQWIFLQLFNSWYDDSSNRARPVGELVAELESGRRDPVTAANPASTPWAQLNEQQRRQVIDSYRLAYISEQMVNWCPGLGTVLANEEVTTDGRSDIGNYPVYRRPLRQWMLRITAYADRLIDDLALVDWPESITQMQRNWIGRADGAHIDFAVVGQPNVKIRAFTTRPDTLPGATFFVLAPEHPLVDQLLPEEWPAGTPDAWNYGEGRADSAELEWTPRRAAEAYRSRTSRLSERQRIAEQDRKTGVFTGSFVLNPLTEEEIPVFMADYVLMDYGAGAVMGVPAHDQRDLDFARALGLPVRAVLEPPEEWFEARNLVPQSDAASWVIAFTGEGAYGHIAESPLSLAGSTKHDAIELAIDWLESQSHGRRAHSYRLRDWLFSRQRYWGEPFPIVYDEDGQPLALPESMLPVELPPMDDFSPQTQGDEMSDPVPPLARARDWVEVELDLGDGPKRYRREVNTMPQWAGSCWYYLRYLDPSNEQRFVDPTIEEYWMQSPDTTTPDGGVDLYVGGVEHGVLHLLYARFWHKVLYDLGFVCGPEPFHRLFNQGYILADAFTDSRGMYVPATEVVQLDDEQYLYRDQPVTRRAGKMGKSLKNSVSPDDIYASYGADTLRLYEMAMGPLDADRPWRTDDIVGMQRFLQRLWRNLVNERTGALLVNDSPLNHESARRLHTTIDVVTTDFSNLRFNTAIARLIELNHYVTKLASGGGGVPRALAEPLVQMLSPLAPHIAEELWSKLGHSGSVTYAPFPKADPVFAAPETLKLPVEVNGRVRFFIEVGAGAGEEETREAVVRDERYAKYAGGKNVRRIVVVPGRIVNVVLS